MVSNLRPYKSPAWLKEPAHGGKPTPEEFQRYMSYLRYQLGRGVAPGAGANEARSAHAVMSTKPPTAEQLQILKALASGPMSVADLVPRLGLSTSYVGGNLQSLRERQLVELRPDPHRHRPTQWRILPKGTSWLERLGEAPTTPADPRREDVVARYQQGNTIREIVRDMHIKTKTVCDIIRAAGIGKSPGNRTTHPLTKLTEAQVAEIVLSDESSEVLGPRYGVSPGHIRRIRRERRGRQGEAAD